MALFVLFVVGNRKEIPAAWRELRTANLLWVGAAIAASLAGVVDLGLLHGATQRAAGVDLGARRAVELGAAGHFMNMVAKSGGWAGLTPFMTDARQQQRPVGATVAGYALATVLGELAFAVTLIVGLVLLAVDGRLTRNEVLAAAAFSVLFIVRISLFAAAARSRSAVRGLYALPNRVASRFRRRSEGRASNAAAADELYEAVQLLRERPALCLPAAGWAFGVELCGVAMLWCVVASVHGGHAVSVAVVGYAISVMFSIIGILPAGLGFVEVSLGAALVSFGLPLSQATAAVALYRVAELWVPVAVGALMVQRLRRGVFPTTEVP